MAPGRTDGGSNGARPGEWLERTGALHVHSRYSDGAGSVEEILAAARGAGLDFVVLADHDNLGALREGWQGVHDGVALVIAAEVTPWRQGHLLALCVRHCEGYAVRPNRRTMDAVGAQGGYIIVAHPMGKRKRSLGIHHTPLYDWRHPAVRGIEIWSYMHDWVDGVEWWRLPAAYEFWKRPQRRVRGPDPTVLRQWDWLGRERRLSGLGGLDCHAWRVPLTRLELFSYRQMFGFVRNHLFIRPEDWRNDPIAALTEALAEGRGFVAHDLIADSAGARCDARLPDGRALQMGQETPFAKGTRMTLALPRAAEVRWIANGQCRLKELTDRLSAAPAGPGVYRFEARLEGAPWIFTNPFYLRP
jgi:hypothetical protein